MLVRMSTWDNVDKLLSEMFNTTGVESCDHMFCDKLPIQERSEDGLELTLRYDVPGFSKDDLEITLNKDVLSIVGKKGHRKMNYRWRVKEAIDAQDISAVVENGELILTIKRAVPVSKKIVIK